MRDTKQTLVVAGIVLAGGASTRLGEPKQLLEYAGEPLVARAARAALGQCDAGVVVVTGSLRGPVEAALAGTGSVTVHNPDWREGMAASIRHGVEATAAHADAFLLMVCDQPRVGAAELSALLDAWRRDPGAVAASGYAGTLGVPAVFPASYRGRLMALRGDSGARALIDGADALTVVDMPTAAFDVDTPDDARRMSGAGPGGC